MRTSPGRLNVLIAPTAFKGTLTPRQAADAIARGLKRGLPEARLVICPVADGGDGFLECLAGNLPINTAVVCGPLGNPVEVPYSIRDDGTAIMETALCCGLALLKPEERDPLRATTRGLGELLRLTFRQGAKQALVGLGGSATNDGGAGVLQALGFSLKDASGKEIGPGGAELIRLAYVNPPEAREWPTLICACDVTNPLIGPEGCTAVYGPQKGVVSERQREVLERGLRRLAELGGLDPYAPGTGAAGGLAYGLAAFCGARLERGAPLVLRELRFEALLNKVDAVITGEGKLDSQTIAGKVVGVLLEQARDFGVPAFAVCGVLGPGWEQLRPLLAAEPIEIGDPDRAFERLEASMERLSAVLRATPEPKSAQQ